MITVGLVLFEDVDLLDTGGPYEVFLTASRLAERRGEAAPFRVLTLGVDDRAVTAYGGLRLIPDTTLAAAPHLDVLLVPGAIAIDRVVADEVLLDAIAAAAARSDVVGSVCTGAFVLGALGRLEGRPWTTHWEDVDLLAAEVGGDGARRGVRWVDDGTLVTAGGLSCGIDLALHLVDRFAGRELATATARQIDHAWDPEGRPVEALSQS